jgi:hypothetical protein
MRSSYDNRNLLIGKYKSKLASDESQKKFD